MKKGEVLLAFERNFVSRPSRFTLQIDEGVFQISSSPGTLENYINHSCDPNCYIDFSELVFRARRKIRQGEELSFNYNTTEWDMERGTDKGFVCCCSAENCVYKVRGFRYLSPEIKAVLRPILSPFLTKKLLRENARLQKNLQKSLQRKEVLLAQPIQLLTPDN